MCELKERSEEVFVGGEGDGNEAKKRSRSRNLNIEKCPSSLR